MLTPTIAFIARGGGVGGPGLLFPLLVLVLLGVLITWLIRRRTGGPGRASAMSVLQERFARGDIDQAEFEHRKAVLTGADTVPPSGSDPGAGTGQ
ncbi:MAG: SHOCT domain-containing protein [Actinomycetota bacterium]